MRKKMKFCPVPLAFGPSGTGKTTSLLCALSLFGGTANRFYSMVTKEKIIDLGCTCGVPFGVDDPQSDYYPLQWGRCRYHNPWRQRPDDIVYHHFKFHNS